MNELVLLHTSVPFRKRYTLVPLLVTATWLHWLSAGMMVVVAIHGCPLAASHHSVALRYQKTIPLAFWLIRKNLLAVPAAVGYIHASAVKFAVPKPMLPDHPRT